MRITERILRHPRLEIEILPCAARATVCPDGRRSRRVATTRICASVAGAVVHPQHGKQSDLKLTIDNGRFHDAVRYLEGCPCFGHASEPALATLSLGEVGHGIPDASERICNTREDGRERILHLAAINRSMRLCAVI